MLDLTHLPVYRDIADPVGREILAQAQQLSLPPQTPVFEFGCGCSNFMILLEGTVRVFKRAEDGREIALYHVYGGESCVLTTSCLLGHNLYPAEGITETPATALVIPQELFFKGISESPDFRDFVFHDYGSRISDLMSLVDAMAFSDLDARLAKLLLKRRNGEQQVIATHQDLATELGSAREVVSRYLKELETQGMIELKRGRILVLNADALQQRASP